MKENQIRRYSFKNVDGEMFVCKRISLSKALRSLKRMDVDIDQLIECHSNAKRVPDVYFKHIRDHVLHGKE